MWRKMGVRGRLLLAFLGISAFALIAAAAGMISFFEVGEVMNRITQRKVPSALASQDLSRQSERIVAAAPKLLTVTTLEEHMEVSNEIAGAVHGLNELLAEIESSDIESPAYKLMSPTVNSLTFNLDTLDTLISERLNVADRKKELLLGIEKAYNGMQKLLTPWLMVTRGQIGQWRRAVDDSSFSLDERTKADIEAAQSIELFRSLQKVQREASVINDMVHEVASTEDPQRLKVLVFRFRKSLREIQRRAPAFEPKMGQQLLDRTNELNGFIVGENSLPNQRARELGLLATASQLLAENTELSRELTEIVDQLVSDAKQDIADANSEALSVQKFSTVVLVAVGALSLASSILIVWLYVGRNLITRLTTLSDSMLAIAGGNLEAKIPSGGNDEITDMAKALSVFLDTTKSRDEFRGAKERMEGELNAAKEIQMSMLPLTFPPFPQRSEFSVFATLAPAREVGGDFYDFFFIDEDRFCFCIGDVSGKGVPAALFMAVSKSLIKSRATADFSSASIITHVNNELGRDNDACMFVTVFLGILDVKTGALTYTNAGHNPPYLLQSDGGVIQLNQCHGLVVAAMEGTVYGEDKITVIPGDLLLTYTDGVTEAMDVNEALYSDERLTSLMSSRQFESAEEIVDVTVSDVWDFQGDAEQADDVTVLAIQYFGEPKGKAL